MDTIISRRLSVSYTHLSGIHLVEKTGGKSGHYIRSEGGYV